MRILVQKLSSLVVLALVLVSGCSSSAAPSPSRSLSPGTVSVRGVATAGPVCPVERPGDPACAPRPVSGATIVVESADGTEFVRVATGADGSFVIDLPAGNYVLVPQPVAGLMRAPDQVSIVIPAQGSPLPAPLQIQYDTGIR